MEVGVWMEKGAMRKSGSAEKKFEVLKGREKGQKREDKAGFRIIKSLEARLYRKLVKNR